jgi:hypothetical protein
VKPSEIDGVSAGNQRDVLGKRHSKPTGQQHAEDGEIG